MWIKVGDQEYELSTKLGVGKRIEDKFKVPVMQLLGKLGEAHTDELVDILCIAAGKTNYKAPEDAAFRQSFFDEWDYTDLVQTVQELVAHLMFSGTPEQTEAKLTKLPIPDNQKNAIRRLLGMPLPAQPETTSDPSDSSGSGLLH